MPLVPSVNGSPKELASSKANCFPVVVLKSLEERWGGNCQIEAKEKWPGSSYKHIDISKLLEFMCQMPSI